MTTKSLPDDDEFNISFVQAVEKHPCLYDNTLKSYSNRSEQDKGWNQVAGLYFSTEKEGTTYFSAMIPSEGAECKKKWKVLRGSLTRYLKQRIGKSGDSAKSKKKYYLWDVLQFVLPFTKSRPQSGNIPNSIEDEMFENENSSADEHAEDFTHTDPKELTPSYHPQSDLDQSNSSRTPSSLNRSSTKRKALSKPQVDEMESAVVGYLSQRNVPKPENPDLDFFKSILPDVGALNASQKRKFKVLVLQTLESMLQATNTSQSCSPVCNDRAPSTCSIYSSDTQSSNMALVYNNHTDNPISNPSSGMQINGSINPPNYQFNLTPNQNDFSLTQLTPTHF